MNYTKTFNEHFTIRADVDVFDVSDKKLDERLGEVEMLVEQALLCDYSDLLLAFQATKHYEAAFPKALDSATVLLDAIHEVASEIATREIAIAFGPKAYMNKVSITFKERL